MTRRDVVQDAKRVIELGIRLLEEQGDIVHFDGEDNPKRMFYLGSILSLSPSGKYYTPWACSNVDACPRCHGIGGKQKTIMDSRSSTFQPCSYCDGLGSREAALDAIWRETLESEASKHNAWIEAGEGDACDLFLCREIEQSSKESEKI